MATSVHQLEIWMSGSEDEHIEFKEAKNSFHFDDLVKYCVALANEGGGKLILGVTNKKPRRVVGTSAYGNLEKPEADLFHALHFRVEAERINHPSGNVIVFYVPSRPIGTPIQYKGTYWMRVGEELAPMTPDRLRLILIEAHPDFSAELCTGANVNDLNTIAISKFQGLWHRKSGNDSLLVSSNEQLLSDAELIINGGITYAALVLLGTRQALGRFLGQAEVVFEYRSNEASIQFQQRVEYRQGFFLFFDDIWETINLRNDLQHFQYGPFIFDVPTFNEQVVREALLNAVSHRDYRSGGSVFVRQYPAKLEIVSPGGLPEGITPENILDKQYPRNRRIAENLVRSGLVEKSGQGFDRIFAQTIREAKPLPDFTGTDAHQVALTFQGTIQDPSFLRFLEKVGQETNIFFSVRDLLVLNSVHKNGKVPEALSNRVPTLIDAGVLESVNKGRETTYLLARRFYELTDKRGVYTRRIGLAKEQNKALILKHLELHGKGTFYEFQQVLPALSRNQIVVLLRELRQSALISFVGVTRHGYWQRKGK